MFTAVGGSLYRLQDCYSKHLTVLSNTIRMKMEQWSRDKNKEDCVKYEEDQKTLNTWQLSPHQLYISCRLVLPAAGSGSLQPRMATQVHHRVTGAGCEGCYTTYSIPATSSLLFDANPAPSSSFVAEQLVAEICRQLAIFHGAHNEDTRCFLRPYQILPCLPFHFISHKTIGLSYSECH